MHEITAVRDEHEMPGGVEVHEIPAVRISRVVCELDGCGRLKIKQIVKRIIYI